MLEGSAVASRAPGRPEEFSRSAATISKLNRTQSRSASSGRTVGDGIPAMEAALHKGGPLHGTWLKPPSVRHIDRSKYDMDRRKSRKAKYDAMSQKMKGAPPCGPHIAAPTPVRGRQGNAPMDDGAMKAPAKVKAARPSSAPCGQRGAKNSVASDVVRSGVGRHLPEFGSAANALRRMPPSLAPAVELQAVSAVPPSKKHGGERGSSVAAAAPPPSGTAKAMPDSIFAQVSNGLSGVEAAALLQRVTATEDRLRYLEGKIKASGITMSVVSALPPSELELRRPPSSSEKTRARAAPTPPT
eukprot:gnl/TRDRNA2_/TRDRNA2_151719_c0_seq1.p1 gnl/TRDRNA2_/TRDRNA2_151719_c0~~gnl/TRDRNA2_/TRDRNA2_151719_c0_seq1.p1  ORF type:complete len:343 (+),score=55.92 gnl/TRDRNA2_/TRDRNA2_151719_c0_seq1:130-1029(+)